MTRPRREGTRCVHTVGAGVLDCPAGAATVLTGPGEYGTWCPGGPGGPPLREVVGSSVSFLPLYSTTSSLPQPLRSPLTQGSLWRAIDRKLCTGNHGNFDSLRAAPRPYGCGGRPDRRAIDNRPYGCGGRLDGRAIDRQLWYDCHRQSWKF